MYEWTQSVITWSIVSQPFRSQANSLPGANRPIGPWPIRSWPFRSLELSFPGAKWPGNFRCRGARPMSISAYRHRPSHLRDRKSQTSKVPGNEMATKRKGQGGNWPGFYWPIRSRERIGTGAKRLGTVTVMVIFLDKTLLPNHKEVHLARVITRQWNICVSMPQNLEQQFCRCRNSCSTEMHVFCQLGPFL